MKNAKSRALKEKMTENSEKTSRKDFDKGVCAKCGSKKHGTKEHNK